MYIFKTVYSTVYFCKAVSVFSAAHLAGANFRSAFVYDIEQLLPIILWPVATLRYSLQENVSLIGCCAVERRDLVKYLLGFDARLPLCAHCRLLPKHCGALFLLLLLFVMQTRSLSCELPLFWISGLIPTNPSLSSLLTPSVFGFFHLLAAFPCCFF